MKFSIEIDATPKEVRDSLGLPDIQAVQDRVIESIEERVLASVDTFDPLKLLNIFVPQGSALVEGLQKTLFEGISTLGKRSRSED